MLEVVAAAIWDGKDKVLIAQKASQGKQAGLWEFPGGKLESNETLEEALIREIQEELSLHIQVLEKLGESIFEDKNRSLILSLFICKKVSGILKLRDHTEVQWVTDLTLEDRAWMPADIAFLAKVKAWLQLNKQR